MAENRQFQQPPQANRDNNFSDDSSSWLPPNVDSMSNAELMQIAYRQKRQIESNNAAMAAKEAKLNNFRSGRQQNAEIETETVLTSRLHQLRQQIKSEDVQLQRLRRLKMEIEDERRRSLTVRFDLQEARRLLTEKERLLKETAGRVQDLMQQLEVGRRRRAILTSKENELRLLDYALASNGTSSLDNDGGVAVQNGDVASAPSSSSMFPSPPHYQRPKAAIEPFSVVPPSSSSHSSGSIMTEKRLAPPPPPAGSSSLSSSSLDYMHSKGFVAAFTAMEEALIQQDRSNTPIIATGRTTPAAPNGHLPPPAPPVTYSKLPLCRVYQPPASSVVPKTASDHRSGVKQYGGGGGKQQLPTADDQSNYWMAPTSQQQHHRRSDTPLPPPLIPKVNISINRRFQIANASHLLYEEMPPPDLIPASEKLMKYAAANFDDGSSSFDGGNNHNGIFESSSSSSFASSVGGGGGEEALRLQQQQQQQEAGQQQQPRGDADKIHLRNNTLRAAKRRSWAENHLPVTTDEAEHIRLLLTRAQQKGKSSVNLSWIFDQLTTTSGSGQNFLYGQQNVSSSMTADQRIPASSISAAAEVISLSKIPSPPPLPPPAAPSTLDFDGPNPTAAANAKMEVPPPSSPPFANSAATEEKTQNNNINHHDENDELEMFEIKDLDVEIDAEELLEDEDDEEATIAKRGEDGGSDDEGEGGELDDRSGGKISSDDSILTKIELKPPPAKGILRAAAVAKQKPEEAPRRRVQFDALTLLLDAALEGQLDLVKECASKLSDVSTCNEEGITALHNAICAGHYDIVRFLVEAGADVNAEDRDGWTPLHCAASCNNLPMVKFLIERGACVFATTTKDHETPADKCEKDEEGFDGCSQFLYNVQEKMGVLNGGRVYAAYDYEAELEDELRLRADEPVVILRREEEDGKGTEKGWWWAKRESDGQEGFVPRNYIGLYPRLIAQRASGSVITASNSTAPAPESESESKVEPEPDPETSSNNNKVDATGNDEILPSGPTTIVAEL